MTECTAAMAHYIASDCTATMTEKMVVIVTQTLVVPVGCVLLSQIHLIFNYWPGLVGLELIQNICKGRGVPRALYK